MTLRLIAATLAVSCALAVSAQDVKPAAAKPAAKKPASRPAPEKKPSLDELPPLTDEAARAQSAIPQCQIKPVMTDAEIDRCRPRRR
jgi:hypothetical protein